MSTELNVTITSIPPIQVSQAQSPPADGEEDKLLEYNLKVEEHADKFFEMKHKISFFLITAGATTIAYTLNFSITKLSDVAVFPERKACLIVASLAALVTVALALFSMYYDVHANRLNLRAYFDRKLYQDLPAGIKKEWAKTGERARDCEVLAFTFLGISIAYQAAFFMLFMM